MDGPIELARRDGLERVPAGKQPTLGQHDAASLALGHHSRSSSNSCGDSMALRSLRPLPCSTWISMRVLSMSPTLRVATSDTRNPAPYAVPRAALYFGPGATSSSRPTSSTLSTVGSLGVADDDEAARQVRPIERHREEEAQRRNRAIDALRLHATLGLVDLEAADILRCRRIGWALEERGEAPHETDIVTLRILAQAAHGHVFEHALPQQAYGL